MLVRNANFRSCCFVLALATLSACKSGSDDGPSADDDDAGGNGGQSEGGRGGANATGGAGVGGKGGGAGQAASGGQAGNAGGKGGSAGQNAGGMGGAGGALGGASSCANGNYAFCDGFEGDSINSAVWDVEAKGTAKIGIDKTQHARGASSLHVTLPASSDVVRDASAHVIQKMKIAALKNHYFARFFIKLPKSIPGPAHSWFFSDQSTQLGMQGFAWRLFMFSKDGKENAKSPDATLMQERWVCLEWEVDSPNNLARLWVDDAAQPFLMPLEAGWLDALDHPKYFGFDVCCDFQDGWQATEAWLDELVMDTKRIHCQ